MAPFLRSGHSMGASLLEPRSVPELGRPVSPGGERRRRLVAWLDDGLRRGERGRLEREYPLSMTGTRGHRCLFAGDDPIAHAMLHPARAVTRGREIGLGMIGNVYTDPAWRRRGLASRCVEACARDARGLGLPLAVLWSDAWDLYRGLGFHPAGRETQLRLDAAVWRRLGPPRRGVAVGEPQPGDWPRLEALYAAKPQHARRSPGDFQRLAAAPGTTLVVGRRGDQVAGYAAAGRGDDFQGAVHEWAGEEAAVLACLRALFERAGAAVVLSGPEPEPVASRLLAAGARASSGCFGLVRLLDAGRLWRAIAPEDRLVQFRQLPERVEIRLGRVRVELGDPAALDLLLGQGPVGPVGAALPTRLRRHLARRLPWPVYVWGFDSV